MNESRTSIDLGEVKEKDDVILIRSTKIENLRDYLKGQLININIANAGFLITMIILSASVQSTLKQQQEYNVETQNLLSSVTASNNELQNSLANANSQINTLNVISININTLYNAVISTGSLLNLVNMNKTNELFNNQLTSFQSLFLMLQNSITDLQKLNQTVLMNNLTLIENENSLNKLQDVVINTNVVKIGLSTLYLSSMNTCFQDLQSISQGFSILNLCVNDPNIITVNPSSGIVSTTDWENGRGFMCSKQLCHISGSIEFQTFGSGTGSAQVILGYNGTSVANLLMATSLSQNPTILFPIDVGLNKNDVLQIIINLSGSSINYQAQFNHNVFYYE